MPVVSVAPVAERAGLCAVVAIVSWASCNAQGNLAYATAGRTFKCKVAPGYPPIGR